MLLTSDEAKTQKKCPFTRKPCLGTDCMVWRFEPLAEGEEIRRGWCGAGGRKGAWRPPRLARVPRPRGDAAPANSEPSNAEPSGEIL